MEVPHVQFLDLAVDVPVMMQRQAPQERIQERLAAETNVHVPHVIEKTIEVVKFIPQERVQNRTVSQIIDVPVPRVMEEILEVETRMSQRFDGESTLLAGNKLSSKLDGSCAALRGLRDEELVTIHDTNKLPNYSDSLELFKETVPSPSMMQVQSDKRGVACRARAVVRNSSESPDVNSTSMAIGNENVDFRVSSFQQEQADDALAGQRMRTRLWRLTHRSSTATTTARNGNRQKRKEKKRRAKEKGRKEERMKG